MFDLNDTIVAVSSGLGGEGARKIIRMSGGKCLDYFKAIAGEHKFRNKIYPVHFAVEDVFMAGEIYVFMSPNSYTGDDMVEVHFDASDIIVEAVMEDFIKGGMRLAEPGEFTARAYLNGKIGLAQAEAVAEIVSAGSKVKLEAAEKLLAGRLSHTIGEIREKILERMSLIEAGLDFSDQEIGLGGSDRIVKELEEIARGLQNVLDGSIHYEAVVDMPGVGIAGAPNAGKSSLTNAMLGWERSIVSSQPATTRDVLTGEMQLENNDCVIFDCAGLIMSGRGIMDELAQQAAVDAIREAAVMVFCIETGKQDYREDVEALELVRGNFAGPVICVLTKCDLAQGEGFDGVFEKLGEAESTLCVSSKTGQGIKELKTMIDDLLGQLSFAGGEGSDAMAINRRHVEVVEQAVGNVRRAVEELRDNREEICAMFLRESYEVLGGIENEPVDEKMLGRIFSTFCIGK